MSRCPNCAVANPTAHSATPTGTWEFGVVAVGLVLVALALVAALKLLLRPGERAPEHIKRTILDDTAVPPQEG
ncbi:MAG: hypothetical protein KC776_28680 [Myxococcales bacterium]|nr:hypothetical protein [Myxococcales bacterium]MCB9576622.1 hypothetical protein [Polyangiaceae bacterium]